MPTVNAWRLEDEDEEVVKLVKATPLYHLLSSYKNYDPVIISAFVERWHPETNTFHLPIGELIKYLIRYSILNVFLRLIEYILFAGEMTITLDDVHQITRLPIIGKAMVSPALPQDTSVAVYTARLLGVSTHIVNNEFQHTRVNSVSMGWLVKTFAKVERTSSDYTGEFRGTNEDVARAFLLRLLGCTIFSDTSTDKVPVRYVLIPFPTSNYLEYYTNYLEYCSLT